MTTCATETARDPATVRRAGFTIAADGSYAACLAAHGTGDEWFPERWTLGGPEPYTVPLPGNQPEDPESEVLPLPDGRVLIRRRVADRHDFALLYPTGPGTGVLPIGSLEGEEVRLLPPSPGGDALALTYDGSSSTVWLVHAGEGLRALAGVPGRCGGGAWLDRTGRMLALDREAGGQTKLVAVDLARGDAGPLLQITEDSNDRLLLAEPDSGLLVLRSDAPGEDRLGWCVLGSRHPVRFPELLRPPEQGLAERQELITPFAAQPGQMLTPEACGVALRHGSSLAVWQPGERRSPLTWLTGPEGWLSGVGWWTGGGVLRLPYACVHCPCGIVDYEAPTAVTPALPLGLAVPAEDVASSSAVLPLQQAPLTPAGPVTAGS